MSLNESVRWCHCDSQVPVRALMYHQSQISRESTSHELLTDKGMHSRRMLCRMHMQTK